MCRKVVGHSDKIDAWTLTEAACRLLACFLAMYHLKNVTLTRGGNKNSALIESIENPTGSCAITVTSREVRNDVCGTSNGSRSFP